MTQRTHTGNYTQVRPLLAPAGFGEVPRRWGVRGGGGEGDKEGGVDEEVEERERVDGEVEEGVEGKWQRGMSPRRRGIQGVMWRGIGGEKEVGGEVGKEEEEGGMEGGTSAQWDILGNMTYLCYWARQGKHAKQSNAYVRSLRSHGAASDDEDKGLLVMFGARGNEDE